MIGKFEFRRNVDQLRKAKAHDELTQPTDSIVVTRVVHASIRGGSLVVAIATQATADLVTTEL
jgi:hypothetical protein